MNYKIAVITRVPDPETDDGNLAAALVYRLPSQLRLACVLQGRTPVFHLGEILILDGNGREVVGLGRKPSKWDVGYQTFAALDEAIVRAQEVMQQAEPAPDPARLEMPLAMEEFE